MKHIGFFFLLTLLLWAPATLAAQRADALATRWSDAFDEWIFFREGEEVGYLEPIWRNNWTQWRLRIDTTAEIRQVREGDPTYWELSTPNEVVTARALWTNDLSQWRISDDDIRLRLNAKWANRSDEWIINDKSHGRLYFYAYWEGDPRDWIIVDQLGAEVSDAMWMMAVFVGVVNSFPK